MPVAKNIVPPKSAAPVKQPVSKPPPQPAPVQQPPPPKPYQPEPVRAPPARLPPPPADDGLNMEDFMPVRSNVDSPNPLLLVHQRSVDESAPTEPSHAPVGKPAETPSAPAAPINAPVETSAAPAEPRPAEAKDEYSEADPECPDMDNFVPIKGDVAAPNPMLLVHQRSVEEPTDSNESDKPPPTAQQGATAAGGLPEVCGSETGN